MKPRALVFSGQGAHRKGMCMDLAGKSRRAAEVWERCKESCSQSLGLPLQEIIRENPTQVKLYDDALEVKRFTGGEAAPSRRESCPRNQLLSHPRGVLSLTCITQPSMVAAHLVALAYLAERDPDYLESFACIAGHSLGEFSALAALGVLTPENAMRLTFQRGLLMEDHLNLLSPSTNREQYRLYACDPCRAALHPDPSTAEDIFFCLVELIARSLSQTASFVEVVNLNVMHYQYVVAGDPVGLAVLGKCLDPQLRTAHLASASEGIDLVDVVRAAVGAVVQDRRDGLVSLAGAGADAVDPREFVSSSARRYGVRHTFHRFIRGPDDGFTPPLEELGHLTLQDEGRSGLRRKSWFVPLAVEIPFHSSRLRRPMDDFLPLVLAALPEEAEVRRRLVAPDRTPQWVVNLTGTSFRPFDADFQNGVREAMASLNIGEVQHAGRYRSEAVLRFFDAAVAAESARDMCAAVLAAQLAHPVMWIDSMIEMVVRHGAREVHEVSPVRTVCEMFRRSAGNTAEETQAFKEVAVKCFPADKMFFEMK